MAKKKVPKKAKRRLIFLGPLAVFAIVYCIFTLVTTGINLYNLNKEEKELKTNLTNLKKDAKSLKTEINKLQDKDYVARYARENYLYTKDGEYVIKVNDDDKKNIKKKSSKTEKYIIYGCAGAVSFIFIFIIAKNKKKKKKRK